MDARTYELRRGLLLRLLLLGSVSIGAFALGYALIGLRVMTLVETSFFVEAIAAIVYLRVARRPQLGPVAMVQALYVTFVIVANTVVLGGFMESAGFAVWSYLPPLASMFFIEGRPRKALIALTVCMLVGLLVMEPSLQPVERIPEPLLPFFFLLNVVGSLVVVLGSLSYFHTLLADERHALAQSESQHRLTLERIPLAVALKDREGRYVFVNAAFEDLFGVRREQVQLEAESLLTPSDKAALEVAEAEAWAASEPCAQEEQLRVGGETRTLHSTRLRMHDATRTPLLCWVANDVTARRNAERFVQNERQLEALGTLAGGIAHDFNNLLMTIQGNVELAALHPLPAEAVVRLGDADRAVGRARDLTRQILTFARGGAPSLAVTSVRSVIAEAATFALTGTASRIALDLPEELPNVLADAGQIGRVVHNLVLNASQSMPNGGTVRVRARAATAPADIDGLSPERACVCIEVEDEGHGIAPEHLPRIFDPFFTTRALGSGLGLTTSHSIVRQHDGALVVRSHPGKGTCVRVYLPTAEGTGQTPAPQTRARTRMPSVRVLVMDDDPLVRDTLSAMLRRLGHSVDACAEGRSAVEAYGRARKGHAPYDAVLLDLTVPGGMGGIEAAQRIRADDPDAVLVAATGYAEDAVKEQLRGHGFRATLDKPFRMSDVARTLAAATMAAPAASA